jgi:hypothetical protein
LSSLLCGKSCFGLFFVVIETFLLKSVPEVR